MLFNRKRLKIRLFPFSNIVNLKSKKISHRQDVSTIFCSVLGCFHSAVTCLPKANLQAWPSHQAEWRPGGPRTRALDVSGLWCGCWSCNLSVSARKPGSSQIREHLLEMPSKLQSRASLESLKSFPPSLSGYSYAFAATSPFFAVLSSH